MRIPALLFAAGVVAGRPAPAGASIDERPLRTVPVGSAVYALAQTPDGILWLGTEGELWRYDGQTLAPVPQPRDAETLGAPIRALCATRDGALWIALGGQPRQPPRPGLLRLSAGHGERVRRQPGLPDDRVSALAEDASGALWLGTESGLVRHDGRGFTFVGAAGLPDPAVRALRADAAGRLWIGTAGGLAVLEAGRVRALGFTRPVRALAAARDGTIWIGTSDGLAEWRGDRVARWLSKREGLSAADVVALLADARGSVWAATSEGLDRIAGEHVDVLRSPEWLPDEKVLALLEDREGSVWVGTHVGGAAQLRVARVRTLRASDGLAGDTVFAVWPARDGAVWISSVRGVTRWRAEGARAWVVGGDLPGGVRSVAGDARGRVWFSRTSAGLLRFDGERFAAVPAARDGRDTPVAALGFDAGGRLWLAWPDGGLSRFDGGSPDGPERAFTAADGACPGRVQTVVAAHDGGVWTAGAGGVGHVSDAGARCWGAADGLPGAARTVHEDARGRVWIGGQFAGLALIDGGRVRRLPQSATLDVSVYGATEDGAGGLWLATGHGLWTATSDAVDRFLDGGAAQLPFERLGADDGMATEQATDGFAPAVARDGAGRIWAATLLGASIVTEPRAAPAPPVTAAIDAVLVDGRAQPVGQPLRVGPGPANVEIGYRAVTLVAGNRARFQHRLDGLDARWVDAGARRSVLYAGLPPGRYRFAVRVSTASGDLGWSAAAAVALEVAPHFYRTRAFLGALVVALSAFALVLHRMRVRRVEERHRAIDGERARIARDLHDSLGQTFTAIGLHLDAALTAATVEGKPRKLLQSARGIVDQGRVEARRLIWDLRQPHADAGLVAQVRAVAARAERELGVSVAFASRGGRPARSGEVEHEVPLLVQEAIANAVRHGRARHVNVELAQTDARLEVSIRDDGGGFDPSRVDGAAAGLVGMRERARRLGGEVTIVSAAGRGAEITLAVPHSSEEGEA